MESVKLHCLPRLRRSYAQIDFSLEQRMRHSELDLHAKSNSDVISLDFALKNGKFLHPRARQMQAAARYGWKFTNEEALHPENWLDELSWFSTKYNPYIKNKTDTMELSDTVDTE